MMGRMGRARAGFVVALFVGLASRGAAASRLDPARADALVTAARAEGKDGFCKSPARPLSFHARSLCPLAREVKDCEGLVAACDDDPLATKRDGPHWELGSFGSFLGLLMTGIVWVLVAAAVGILLWFIVRAIQRAQRDQKASEPAARPITIVPERAADVLETLTDADLLLHQADEHARRGELDRAAALYLAASLRALDRRGAIRIARHRTNGEYVRSCKEPGAKPDLRAIVNEVDRVEFGREKATPDRIRDVATRANAIVSRAAQVALLSLAAILLASCAPKPGSGLRANDPIGDDLLFSLLERSGASVSRLSASLATLPIPKEGETAPLVIVDASRVPLEDETGAHLARWVEAGGRLLLAGEPGSWPESFKAKPKGTASTGINVLIARTDDRDEDDDDDDEPASTFRIYPAKVGTAAALEWPQSAALATTDTHEVYGAVRAFERGVVIGLAGDDLLTNAGIARAPNAAALIAILSVYADGRKIEVARPEDGISPPDNPVSSLLHAGLGLPLAHAAAATLILMLAFGIRQARAKVSPPKTRRAWTEHIEAAGGLYARARLAPHALSAYARFVDGRLRERMPRGLSDPAAFLALRANVDPAWAAQVWQRAMAARSADRAEGDELGTLAHLSALYAAAMKSE
jgi:hypothetical protein